MCTMKQYYFHYLEYLHMCHYTDTKVNMCKKYSICLACSWGFPRDSTYHNIVHVTVQNVCTLAGYLVLSYMLVMCLYMKQCTGIYRTPATSQSTHYSQNSMFVFFNDTLLLSSGDLRSIQCTTVLTS